MLLVFFNFTGIRAAEFVVVRDAFSADDETGTFLTGLLFSLSCFLFRALDLVDIITPLILSPDR